MEMPDILEVEQFFEGIRNPENIVVDGYYRVKRKVLTVYIGGVDNLESAKQIDIGSDLDTTESEKNVFRVYYLHYKVMVPQTIVDLAFENIHQQMERLIFQVSRNLDVLIDRKGNLIFLKNRARGFIQQDLVTHLLHKEDTCRLPSETFKKFFLQFEDIAVRLAAKLAQDPSVIDYHSKLLAEN